MDLKAFESFEQLRGYAGSMGVTLNAGDISALSCPLVAEGKSIPNRLLVQPFECCDAEDNGAPSELTRRRYLRFAAGGAGLVWMEATALLEELKSNPHQLVLTEKTLGAFSRLNTEMKEAAVRQGGEAPVLVLQMTHPGRSCITPVPAADRESWEPVKPSKGEKALSDDEIERLAEVYGKVTRLARAAGFDGVEVKACHFYFISELLSAYERPGRYGGSFENRARHLKEALAAARAETGGMLLTVRYNHYDGIPYPDGFGMKKDGGLSPNAEEPLRLIAEIKDEFGVELVNCSSSGPRFGDYPAAERPDDELFMPPNNPLKSGARMHRFAAEVKRAVTGIKVVATEFSQLRQYGAAVGAGMVERGEADLIGFGRQPIAYPDFARDILQSGGMDKEKLCLCCGGCGRMLGAQINGGCVVRDELYKNTSKKRHER